MKLSYTDAKEMILEHYSKNNIKLVINEDILFNSVAWFNSQENNEEIDIVEIYEEDLAEGCEHDDFDDECLDEDSGYVTRFERHCHQCGESIIIEQKPDYDDIGD